MVVCMTIFISCSDNAIIDECQRLEDDKWRSGDLRHFDFFLYDNEIPYSFYINVRHTTDYKYSNLYLFIESIFPDSTKARDTLELILANRDGRWLGNGLGKIKENRILLNNNVAFPDTGNYTVTLEQGMRESELNGISDIGIKIVPTTISQ